VAGFFQELDNGHARDGVVFDETMVAAFMAIDGWAAGWAVSHGEDSASTRLAGFTIHRRW
jgi:hypothetical protein